MHATILICCIFLLVASNFTNIGVHRAIINENSSVSIFFITFLYTYSASCHTPVFRSKFKAIVFNEFNTPLNSIFKLLQRYNHYNILMTISWGISFFQTLSLVYILNLLRDVSTAISMQKHFRNSELLNCMRFIFMVIEEKSLLGNIKPVCFLFNMA